MFRRIARLCMLGCALTAVRDATAEFPMRLQPSVEVSILSPPLPFRDRGCVSLVYELRLWSEEWHDVVLRRLEVLAGDSDRVLASFEGAALRNITGRPGFPDPEEAALWRRLQKAEPDKAPPPFQDPIAEPERIGPGLSAIFFLWLELPADVPTPRTLRHRMTFETWHALVPGPATMTTGATDVLRGEPVALEPPLRGGPWRVTNGPSNTSFHRRSAGPIDGRMSHPERYALDLVKTDSTGHMWREGVAGNEGFFGYGEPVFAVARGEIVEAVNDLPENEEPGSLSRAVAVTWENITGNHVTLRLPGGVYVLYAHLKAGSVRVRVGDTVEVGTVLGLLGNSGNSFGPHLHFQVSTAPGMTGEGVPYILRGTFSGNSSSRATPFELPHESDYCWFP